MRRLQAGVGPSPEILVRKRMLFRHDVRWQLRPRRLKHCDGDSMYIVRLGFVSLPVIILYYIPCAFTCIMCNSRDMVPARTAVLARLSAWFFLWDGTCYNILLTHESSTAHHNN